MNSHQFWAMLSDSSASGIAEMPEMVGSGVILREYEARGYLFTQVPFADGLAVRTAFSEGDTSLPSMGTYGGGQFASSHNLSFESWTGTTVDQWDVTSASYITHITDDSVDGTESLMTCNIDSKASLSIDLGSVPNNASLIISAWAKEEANGWLDWDPLGYAKAEPSVTINIYDGVTLVATSEVSATSMDAGWQSYSTKVLTPNTGNLTAEIVLHDDGDYGFSFDESSGSAIIWDDITVNYAIEKGVGEVALPAFEVLAYGGITSGVITLGSGTPSTPVFIGDGLGKKIAFGVVSAEAGAMEASGTGVWYWGPDPMHLVTYCSIFEPIIDNSGDDTYYGTAGELVTIKVHCGQLGGSIDHVHLGYGGVELGSMTNTYDDVYEMTVTVPSGQKAVTIVAYGQGNTANGTIYIQGE